MLLPGLAPRIVRRHALRSAMRGGVLLVADALTLVVLRACIHGLRDHRWLGARVAHLTGLLLPHGIYPPAQLLTAVLLGLLVFGTYGAGDRRRDAGMLAAGSTLGFSLIFWGKLWTDFAFVPLVGFVVTAAIVATALALERFLVDLGVRRLMPRGAARTLVIGEASAAREAMRGPALSEGGEFNLVGFLHTDTAIAPDALGSIDDLVMTLARKRVDTVVLSGRMGDEEFDAVVDAAIAAGCQVLTMPRELEGSLIKPELVWRQGVPLIQLSRPSLRGQQLAVKRVCDILGASLALLLASPLFLVIAIAIKLDSRGPVFFSQFRAGLGGRRFRMLKFRTMCIDADARKATLAHLNHTQDPRLFKIPNDPRITRVGAMIRRWSLDELPQFWNVLRGDMSLVGPRPFFESDFATYEDHHFRRLGAKPGITGLWQVSGRSSVMDFEEVVRLDRLYIDRWSLWLDFRILAETLPAVVRRTGAF